MLSKIKATLSNIKSVGLTNILLTVGVVLGAGFLPACAGDFVKVDTPAAAVDSGYQATLSVNDSIEAFTEHFAGQQALAEVWGSRIEAGQEKVAFIEGISGAVFSPEGLTAMGFNPVSGLGMGAMFVIGLLRRKPGDYSPEEVKEEKIASYNKAVKVTAAAIQGKPLE